MEDKKDRGIVIISAGKFTRTEMLEILKKEHPGTKILIISEELRGTLTNEEILTKVEQIRVEDKFKSSVPQFHEYMISDFNKMLEVSNDCELEDNNRAYNKEQQRNMRRFHNRMLSHSTFGKFGKR